MSPTAPPDHDQDESATDQHPEWDGLPTRQAWPDPATTPAPEGELELVGRLVTASNATFLARDQRDVRWVYKPVRGEAPLWDFPTGTLSQREIAAHDLSQQAGFAVVPPTVACTGPYGPGSAQLWINDAVEDLADLVGLDHVPDGWHGVIVGTDAADREVALVHAEDPGLRRLALFDLVANNADRKAGHILHRNDGSVLGVDHGLTFHAEPKLRTILWGWAGEPFTEDERALLDRAAALVEPVLSAWLDDAELAAVHQRVDDLLSANTFPEPDPERPLIPWPPI